MGVLDLANLDKISLSLGVIMSVTKYRYVMGIPSHQRSDLWVSKCRIGVNLNSSNRINEPYHDWNCSNNQCFIISLEQLYHFCFVRETLRQSFSFFEYKGCQSGHFKPSHHVPIEIKFKITYNLQTKELNICFIGNSNFTIFPNDGSLYF